MPVPSVRQSVVEYDMIPLALVSSRGAPSVVGKSEPWTEIQQLEQDR